MSCIIDFLNARSPLYQRKPGGESWTPDFDALDAATGLPQRAGFQPAYRRILSPTKTELVNPRTFEPLRADPEQGA